MSAIRATALAVALLGGAAPVIALPTASHAQVSIGISVGVAPPPLPVYAQPPLPGPGYLWTPGYWAWSPGAGDYYWVPGAWLLAPRPGFLWTPAYWGWNGGVYLFHPGYWGPHIGYYGGINYGFGYTGIGFAGGYWNGPHFFYNRSVTNVTNVNITNIYNRPVTINRGSRVSYNGGPGGINARPSQAELAAQRDSHIAATPMQTQHIQAAQSDRSLFAKSNHGAPPVAATAHAGVFAGGGVVSGRSPRSGPTGGAASSFHQPSTGAGAGTHNGWQGGEQPYRGQAGGRQFHPQGAGQGGARPFNENGGQHNSGPPHGPGGGGGGQPHPGGGGGQPHAGGGGGQHPNEHRQG